MKLGLAVLFLAASVALLVFQIAGRRSGGPVGATGPDLTGMVEESAGPAVTRATAAWIPPAAGLAETLAHNPFLRPGRAAARGPGTESVTGSASAGKRRTLRDHDGTVLPHLSGIRMDAVPTVVINDRILEEGEAIAGWRVLSIRRDRVTLRNTHGKTIRIAASTLDE